MHSAGWRSGIFLLIAVRVQADELEPHVQSHTTQTRTLREAIATTAMLSANGVRRSSATNWVSCECVRLQKMICSSGPNLCLHWARVACWGIC